MYIFFLLTMRNEKKLLTEILVKEGVSDSDS